MILKNKFREFLINNQTLLILFLITFLALGLRLFRLNGRSFI